MKRNIEHEELLMKIIRVVYPEASWAYDNDGQLIIYTGEQA